MVDFDGFRSLQPLFDAAKVAGIFVVLRPGKVSQTYQCIRSNLICQGPYINAETTAGGIAHWVTSQVAGDLRSAAADYQASWQDYISGIINATKSNQITEGGPVIGERCASSPLKSDIQRFCYLAIQIGTAQSTILHPVFRYSFRIR